MIPDPIHPDDDMRGQRLGERAFEKGDHARDDRRALTGAKWKVILLTLLLAVAARADETAWRVWLEPKSMRSPVTKPIAHAERTALVAGTLGDGELVPLPRADWDGLKMDWAQFFARTQASATTDLATLKPRYVRNKKRVIEYAALESERGIVAGAVLAPGFLEMFRETLGEKVLLVVPNQSTAYVFPALASNYRDYWPMIFQAYRATAYPVSVEVFEVSAQGMRAVGVFEEP